MFLWCIIEIPTEGHMFKLNFCIFFMINILACNNAEPIPHKVVEKPKPTHVVKTTEVAKVVVKEKVPVKIQKRVIPVKPRTIVIAKAKESFKKFAHKKKASSEFDKLLGIGKETAAPSTEGEATETATQLPE